MSMQFGDGTKTFKYDIETNTATLSRIDEFQTQTGVAFDNIREELNKQIEHTMKFEESSLSFMEATKQSFDLYTRRAATSYAKFLLFVNSRFFRFLNFFGQWYVYSGEKTKFTIDKIEVELYDVHYNVYDNYVKYMNREYHIPLLSRLRYNRRLKKELKTRNR